MSTIYDWVTVLMFFGMVASYFIRDARSDGDEAIWPYLCLMMGAALANQLGNYGHGLEAWLLIAAIAIFLVVFVYGGHLKRFGQDKD